MIALALALALAASQEPSVLDVPVYRSPALGVELPRPFADWVFAPGAERGTTTIIFQPRDGALSDQLWGALVLAPWGRNVPLGSIADRRISTIWRPTLGRTFQLLVRDSVAVDGLQAIHAVMTGSINLAVLDIEEYLVARDSELIVLQFRYPRGVPRDSIATGYARTLAGLRLRGRVAAARAPAPVSRATGSAWTVAVDRGQLVFDLPERLRAVAPGALTAEAVAAGRRTMRWSPTVGRADTALYAVGRFRSEVRRVGRLSVRIWRNESADTTVVRARDELIRFIAEEWGRYWRLFGPVPTTEIALVETAWPETRGGPAVLYLGSDAGTFEFNDWNVRREISRTWWGGLVRDDAGAGTLVADALPEWSATLHGLRTPPRGDPTRGRSDVRALVQASLAAGEPRFREAIRTLVVESRGRAAAIPAFLQVLGDTASAVIRPLIR